MSIEFLPPDVDELTPKITVIGVGGAGGNAIANMIRADVQGVEFLVANTDAQALKLSEAGQRIQLGAKITQGLGAGSRPEIGRAAAEETIEHVQKALEGSHMVFLAAGMGGGTGTGAAPVIAKAARDLGILTVGVVTKPFAFEGKRRAQSAERGIEELQQYVDTLIVIPNQNLFLIANANTTFKEAFEMADEVLQQGVRGITDLMVMPGLINLDFADVRSVMQEMGKAMMGTGEADGDDRAITAAQKAIANPLLDGVSMNGAKGVIVSITGGEDMRLLEVDEAANHIRELVDPDANIIWGSAFNPELEGKIRVSVVATGIEAEDGEQPAAAPAAAEQPRVFSFNTPRRPAATPGFASAPAAEEAPAAPAVPEEYTPEPEAPVEEPVAQDEPEAPAEPAARVEDDGADDELVLGSDAAVPEPAPEAPQEAAAAPEPEEPAPAAPPESGSRRRWLTSEDEEADTPAPAAKPAKKSGGTLFERMASASRGGSRTDEEDDKDSLDIPRFLHRQNNQ
ncbi:cell division protein FtsZ [Stakelama tenebrarum]|uniref:Cell division protein FtsZ n=1 Tax=Stakelama tenebrarum TaxID=2711215 RepID=A0A6G6Y4I1_9SPHN|nr:cell division protein FtsZ [Sphingosinithalassobacter tenebrarum]QIG79810.1 cell division protein FtsZ [Sphingosinithalassobacter tenebrarum]